MSADNGIYVLSTPIPEKYLELREYRVAHAQAIDNIYYYKEGTKLREAELVMYFGRSKPYLSREAALICAHDMAKTCEILEYGVCEIEWPTVFPMMTIEEAENILKEERDRVFEETRPGVYQIRQGANINLYVSDGYEI